jgi:sulfate transport system ATP-binding protein
MIEPDTGTVEAQVIRVVHLGFEVRVELEFGDGAPVTVQLSRYEAEALELQPGQIVYVRSPEPAHFLADGI